jgi:hypothetical protein
MNTAMTPSGAAPMVAREEFGGRQLATVQETATAAVQAAARAAVEARFIMALQRPRDWDHARVRLLRECSRRGFAEVARYSKPVGGKHLVGLSIRFVEAAIRCAGNIDVSVSTLYDDAFKRIVRVCVTDLESNATYASDIAIEKTVERRSLKGNQVALSSRTNSTGDTVYLVASTEDELLTKQGALVSKAVRTLGQRLLPGDILDECEAKIESTLRSEVERDPDGERKRICDAFAGLGVLPRDLEAYLGHPVASTSPAELRDLRAVYVGLRDGEASWADVLAEKAGGGEERSGEGAKASSRTAGLADRIRARSKPAEPPSTPAPDASPDDPDAGP